MVWKADNVWVQNLTACNFLDGSGDTGNEIWWNGGRRASGQHRRPWLPRLVPERHQHVLQEREDRGAVRDLLEQLERRHVGSDVREQLQRLRLLHRRLPAGLQPDRRPRARASTTRSATRARTPAARCVVKNSEFDQNEDGFDTNSQNGDNPPPQNGRVPAQRHQPDHAHPLLLGVHEQLRPRQQQPERAELRRGGSRPGRHGDVVAGGRNDTIMNNRFENNDAWGVIFVAYPDSGKPCTGGTLQLAGPRQGSCLFDDWGDALINNTFAHNGGYGNPTNGDFEQQNFETHPSDCFCGNTRTRPDSTPSRPRCRRRTRPAPRPCPVQLQRPVPQRGALRHACRSSRRSAARPGDHYPQRARVVMHPLPKGLKTMPNPCAGVPRNPWCPSAVKGRKAYQL